MTRGGETLRDEVWGWAEGWAHAALRAAGDPLTRSPLPPRTPAMIGCSFVVDREYFGDIGLLDPGMEVYGGENIELGMRVSDVSGEGTYGRACAKWGRAGLWPQPKASLSEDTQRRHQGALCPLNVNTKGCISYVHFDHSSHSCLLSYTNGRLVAWLEILEACPFGTGSLSVCGEETHPYAVWGICLGWM